MPGRCPGSPGLGLRGRASPGGSRDPGPGRGSPEFRGEHGTLALQLPGNLQGTLVPAVHRSDGETEAKEPASPGALGSPSRSRCDRPSPRSTHRPASEPHAALRRPWASELATKLIGSSWRDQGRRKAVGTKRVVLVSVGAGERDQQRGEERGRGGAGAGPQAVLHSRRGPEDAAPTRPAERPVCLPITPHLRQSKSASAGYSPRAHSAAQLEVAGRAGPARPLRKFPS